MEYPLEEVDYFKYCKTCQFEKVSPTEEPCYECLRFPVNEHSKKPVKWVENAKKS